MNVIFYNNDEYSEAAGNLLSQHYSGKFPVDFFPQTGIAICEAEIPVLIMPVYLEQSSSVAVAGHCCYNEKFSSRKKHYATELAVAQLENFAKKYNKKYIISIWGRKSISNIAVKFGFSNTDVIQQQFKEVK